MKMVQDISFCPYEVLQISRDAEPELIRASHRVLAGKYHPDRYLAVDGFTESDRKNAAEKFTRVTLAYELLSDPVKRAEYNLTHQQPESDPAPNPDVEPEFADAWGFETPADDGEEQIYVKVEEPEYPQSWSQPAARMAEERAAQQAQAAEWRRYEAECLAGLAREVKQPPPKLRVAFLVTTLAMGGIYLLAAVFPTMVAVLPGLGILNLIILISIMKQKMVHTMSISNRRFRRSRFMWGVAFVGLMLAIPTGLAVWLAVTGEVDPSEAFALVLLPALVAVPVAVKTVKSGWATALAVQSVNPW